MPAPGACRDDGTIDVRARGRPARHAARARRRRTASGRSARAPTTGRALSTAVAPDPELIDRDGEPFRLSSLHGRKVLLVAWASY